MRNFLRNIVMSGFLSVGSSAQAQIPVTDLASIFNDIAEHAERIVEWGKQTARWHEQFRRWQMQYETLTGNWEALVLGELSPYVLAQMRETFPAELSEFVEQQAGIFGALQSDYQRLRQQISTLPPDYYPAASELADQLAASLDGIAMQQATADTIYRASQKNLETSDLLRRRVQGADSLKQSTDLNTRINAELLAVQSEAIRLSAIAMRRGANKDQELRRSNEALSRALVSRTPAVTY